MFEHSLIGYITCHLFQAIWNEHLCFFDFIFVVTLARKANIFFLSKPSFKNPDMKCTDCQIFILFFSEVMLFETCLLSILTLYTCTIISSQFFLISRTIDQSAQKSFSTVFSKVMNFVLLCLSRLTITISSKGCISFYTSVKEHFVTVVPPCNNIVPPCNNSTRPTTSCPTVK